MARFVLYAVIAYLAYRVLMEALAWKAQQAELDRQNALAVAEEQRKAAEAARTGAVVSGVGGFLGSVVKLFAMA